MDECTYILTASKFLDICGADRGTAIYSALPIIDRKTTHYQRFYGHILENQPALLDSAMKLFVRKKVGAAVKSYPYRRIKEDKESFFSALELARKEAKIPDKIGEDKLAAALSLISNSYISSFFYPIQFFIPGSSTCSGQWDLWDKLNYLRLRDLFNDKEKIMFFRRRLYDSKVWSAAIKPDDFPMIVKRRLEKEKLFGKKLDPAAMIKAMIIRIGESARPLINYEVIDYSIRKFFTYLNVKNYLRADREIYFLRELEKEIGRILIKI